MPITGVHPGEGPAREVSFMSDDVNSTVAELQAMGIEFDGTPQDLRFGIATTMVLPGGVRVMVYQPHHPTAI